MVCIIIISQPCRIIINSMDDKKNMSSWSFVKLSINSFQTDWKSYQKNSQLRGMYFDPPFFLFVS